MSLAFPRVRKRVALSCFVAVALVGLLACDAATARVGPQVRVLLYRGPGPIQVGLVKAPSDVSLSTSGGLMLGNREQRTSGWNPVGSGPWRVGTRTVRGRIIVRIEAGQIEVLNRVDLENYVASTVGGEMPAGWPREALRAQAIAARTYVLYEASQRINADWDVSATTESQVYGGIAAETDETRAAARATAGEYLSYDGEPILAVFHSTAGGRTATAGEVWGENRPYLQEVAVEDEDDAPQTYWRTVMDKRVLQDLFESAGISVGRLDQISIEKRTSSGRVGQIEVRGSAGTAKVSGRQLRSLLGEMNLRSTLFEIREVPSGFAFVGSGHGHGVGMSQWGARAMAKQGESYQQILARFYPGARLEKTASRRIAVHHFSLGNEGAE